MADGDRLSAADQQLVDRAVRYAEQVSGLRFSLYLGVTEEDSRAYALRLHAALPDPERSVLIMCDPAFRRLELVTGAIARRSVDDIACGLAVATMKSFFLGGELVDGLAAGIQQLGDAGKQAPVLHLRR